MSACLLVCVGWEGGHSPGPKTCQSGNDSRDTIMVYVPARIRIVGIGSLCKLVRCVWHASVGMTPHRECLQRCRKVVMRAFITVAARCFPGGSGGRRQGAALLRFLLAVVRSFISRSGGGW